MARGWTDRPDDGWLDLCRKSLRALREGGPRLLLTRTWRYLRPDEALKFRPWIPQLTVRVGHRRAELARSRYLLADGVPGDEGCVLPGPGDTVVEVGAFRGSDTAVFAKLADRVVAFEPSPRNYERARRNLARFDNVTLLQCGCWSESGERDVQYGEKTADDGFLDPDSGATGTTVTVPVVPLEAAMRELGITTVDFLKIEAEGAEPEVIEGLGDLDVRTIAVNAGPERDGEPTGPQVTRRLRDAGYSLVGMKRGHYLFFTADPVEHAAFPRGTFATD